MPSTNASSIFRSLSTLLLPFVSDGDDGSHDIAHLQRVWKNASRIQAVEGGDIEILAAAVLLHDCISVEKNSPLRTHASRLAAEKASEILSVQNWEKERIARVAHAIEAHSFSANIPPRTLEAKILQDADRLDALGLLGAARCFYTAGRMKSKMYDPEDPYGNNRPLDDAMYAIDHFPLKLFKIGDQFQTSTGSQLAKIRQQRLRVFLEQFLDEI
jgi:uncharacterized protein